MGDKGRCGQGSLMVASNLWEESVLVYLSLRGQGSMVMRNTWYHIFLRLRSNMVEWEDERGMWGLPLWQPWVIFCCLSVAEDAAAHISHPQLHPEAALTCTAPTKAPKPRIQLGDFSPSSFSLSSFLFIFQIAALQPSNACWPEITSAVGSDSGNGLKWPAGHWGRKRGAGRASLCVSHGQR